MREIPETFKHREFHKDFANFMKKWAGHMSSQEMLAIMAYAVGQTIALQDQRTMTADAALEMVGRNIEEGNKYVREKLAETKGFTKQ